MTEKIMLKSTLLAAAVFVALAIHAAGLSARATDRQAPQQLIGTWDVVLMERQEPKLLRKLKPGEAWIEFGSEGVRSQGIFTVISESFKFTFLESVQGSTKFTVASPGGLTKHGLLSSEGDQLILAVARGTAPAPASLKAPNATVVILERRK